MDSLELGRLIVSATIIFILGGMVVYIYKYVIKKEPYKTTSDGGFFLIFSLMGLFPLIIGIVIAARTIHLYANGIEASGTIEKIYFGTGYTSRRELYALVSYETEIGVTEADVQIKRTNSPWVGEEVNVIYLPTLPPRVAIKGYADVKYILFLPLLFILGGSLFISGGIVGWTQKNNDTAFKKRLSSVGFTILITSFLSLFIIVPIGALYTYVPPIYNMIYKSFKSLAKKVPLLEPVVTATKQPTGDRSVKEKTYHKQNYTPDVTTKPTHEIPHEPLLGPGVTATKSLHTDTANACKPSTYLRSLSHTVASSGDIIELHGTWGTFTNNKVPVIVGNGTERLKVLGWTPETIRVELPNQIKKGVNKITVYCFRDSSPQSRVWGGFLDIQIN